MSAWGCPHDANGICQRVQGAYCSPGMRGCEIEGKVRFADPAMNLPRKPVRSAEPSTEEKPVQTGKKRKRLPF